MDILNRKRLSRQIALKGKKRPNQRKGQYEQCEDRLERSRPQTPPGLGARASVLDWYAELLRRRCGHG